MAWIKHKGRKMFERKDQIIEAIEAHQWDYEEDLIIEGVKQVFNKNLIMRKVKDSNSIYANKVIKSKFENDIDKQIEEVYGFFKNKPFSWWIGPNSRPDNLKEFLEKRNMKVIDEYIGLAIFIKNWKDTGFKCPFTITEIRDNNDLKEHVRVSAQVWGLNAKSEEIAFNQRQQYLKLPSKRGNFLVALENSKGVGNASYRVSSDGKVIYLTGSAVLPQYRRMRIYHELLNYRLNMAKQKGCILATVQARKGTSEPILRKLGFKEYGKYYLLVKE